MSVEDLTARVRGFLKRRGAPASSLLLAERFLKILPPGEALATRILDPILRPAGLSYLPDTGWCLGKEARSESPEAAPRQVACAVAVARGAILGLCLREVEPNAGEAPPAIEAAAPRIVARLHWPSIARILEGSEAVFMDPRVEAPPLLAGLSRRALPRPAAVRSLTAAVRGAVRIRRGSAPEEICHALGCAHREGDAPADAAGTIAACLAAAATRRGGPSARGAAPEERAGREEGTLHPTARALSPAFLSRVPALPGVYRFLDEAGSLLYVGKAANLRRRLSTYASLAAGGPVPGGRPRRQGASPRLEADAKRATRVLGALSRVEYEVLGSELEALLKEARLIESRSPRDNIQREVHERSLAYAPGRSHALVLPARQPGAATAVFVRDGRYAGGARLGPRGGGTKQAERILKELLGPARGRPVRASLERDTQILNSWLARNADAVSRVDLDSCRSAAEALRILEGARREIASGSAEVTLRRPRI